MKIPLIEVVGMLNRTPRILNAMLRDNGLADIRDRAWNERIGRLIVIEEGSWIPPIEVILRGQSNPMVVNSETSLIWEDYPINKLLDQFGMARRKNLRTLAEWELSPADLLKFGPNAAGQDVSIREIIEAWVGFDLRSVAAMISEMADSYPASVHPKMTVMKELES